MEYYNQKRKNPFLSASLFMGILSILSICTGFLSLPLGCLGILFAVLAYRKGQKLDLSAILGIGSSIIGIIISIFIIISSLSMIPSLMRSPSYRNQLNDMSQRMYGQSFDSIMKNVYGVDLDKLFGVE